MQNLEKEAVELPNQLLTFPSEKRRRLINRVFTPDATLEHPLVKLCGRDETYDLYQYWAAINVGKVTYDVERFAISPQNEFVVLDGWTHNQPIFAALLGRLRIRIVVFLHLLKTADGYKITQQEDHLLFSESIVAATPILGPFYMHTVRRLTGLFIVLVFQVTHWLSYMTGMPTCKDVR